MKLSEGIAQVKRIEGEIIRNLELKKSIVEEDYKPSTEKISPEQVRKEKKALLNKKKKGITDYDKKILDLISQLIDLKKSINKVNIKAGQDINLLKMKWIRIRLQYLMKFMKTGLFRGPDASLIEELGISNEITVLEGEKAGLDNMIQRNNFNNNL